MEFARLCMKCQEPFGICWNHLRLDVWLICGSCSLFCIPFSFCTWTRLDCHAFVCVNATPRQHTEVRKIGNMCPSESSDGHTIGSALGMGNVGLALVCCRSVKWSTSLVQTKLSQQILDRLLWKFCKISLVPRGFPPWGDICAFEWNISATIAWMAMIFDMDLHVSVRMNCYQNVVLWLYI